MAKKAVAVTQPRTITPEQFQKLAGSVHTYESFGRAVIASVLTEAAKKAGTEAALTVSASVVPVSPQATTFTVGEKAAGSGADGPASHAGCVYVMLTFGDDGPVHTFEICL